MRLRKFVLERAVGTVVGTTVPLLMSGAWMTVAAQSVPVVTGDERVDKLLSQMTLEELTLIHGRLTRLQMVGSMFT
jgi:hypothetical protein